MEKFISHTGIGVPLRRSNVDTDQIIPAVYLKRVTKTGFDDGLFSAWRQDPDFVLNREPYSRGSVLVAGEEFGTGSSREHAVWALRDYGFKAVLSSRFADIFRGNAGKQGLVAAVLSQSDIEQIWKILENAPGTDITVDLENRVVEVADSTFSSKSTTTPVGASWRASMTLGSRCGTKQTSRSLKSVGLPGSRRRFPRALPTTNSGAFAPSAYTGACAVLFKAPFGMVRRLPVGSSRKRNQLHYDLKLLCARREAARG